MFFTAVLSTDTCMELDTIEAEFRRFLHKKRRPDGNPFGENYVKDKISRMRALSNLIALQTLIDITDDGFVDLIELVRHQNSVSKAGRMTSALPSSNDHIVVLRLMYEMYNKPKKAPRYTHYAGVRVPNYQPK
jgi:hypothetical protein